MKNKKRKIKPKLPYFYHLNYSWVDCDFTWFIKETIDSIMESIKLLGLKLKFDWSDIASQSDEYSQDVRRNYTDHHLDSKIMKYYDTDREKFNKLSDKQNKLRVIVTPIAESKVQKEFNTYIKPYLKFKINTDFREILEKELLKEMPSLSKQEIKSKLNYVCKCALKNAYIDVLLEQIIRDYIEKGMDQEDISHGVTIN